MACALAVAAMPACKEPCRGEPAGETWKHQELVAPGGVVCRINDDSAVVDYENEGNVMLKVIDQLDSKGWKMSRRTDTYIVVVNDELEESLQVVFREGGQIMSTTYHF